MTEFFKWPKESKYRNKKTTVDGIEFDSKKEAGRYHDLKALERVGDIKDLEIQPSFLIAEGFRHDEKAYRTRYYVADFAYRRRDNTYIVEDVKSPITRKHPVYRLKIHLFLSRYRDQCLFIET